MPAFITFGRILFAVLFIYSGASKLFESDGDGADDRQSSSFRRLLATYTSQLEAMTGMPMPQMLAIAAGALRVDLRH